ncbi:unnamed protein product [Cuscuta campestris]|uniref:Uncharacterized protein n=1 Tax=Cuscuta campestris TaxID=132261 RepID=A0A484KL47_9ASTE|nr:unnamed protein product [Cuscuta campestris]
MQRRLNFGKLGIRRSSVVMADRLYGMGIMLVLIYVESPSPDWHPKSQSDNKPMPVRRPSALTYHRPQHSPSPKFPNRSPTLPPKPPPCGRSFWTATQILS